MNGLNDDKWPENMKYFVKYGETFYGPTRHLYL